MPTFKDLMKKRREEKRIKPSIIEKKPSRIEKIERPKPRPKKPKTKRMGEGPLIEIDSWIAGAFYKVLTGRSIRGSKAEILSGLAIAIINYLREHGDMNAIDRIRRALEGRDKL